MGATSYIQSSFLGGEASQFIQGRIDLQNYRTFMNVSLNGFPIETGAWVRRPGFSFAQTTRGGAAGRVIKFDFQQVAPYVMEFTDLHLRFFSGRTLVTTNDSVVVSSISTADPAVATLASAVDWVTGDQVYFTLLDSSCPLLQNRVFKVTKLTTTTFSLIDAITDDTIDGSTLGALHAGTTINRILDLTTVYNSGSWATLQSVQTEGTAFLLQGMFQPYAVTVASQPNTVDYATFDLEPAVFNDGPYLDPFDNGVQANPSARLGIITITLSFPAYVATAAYKKGDFVTSVSVNYKSLVDQNVGNTPASSATEWEPVSAGEAIGPHGFQGTDVGRLVRLFSEPELWAVGSTYASGAVVSYNPSGLPGQTTYWSSLAAGNIGNVPGSDLTHWQLMPQGSTSSPAIWSWGRITALSNAIDGNLAGSLNIGDMTSGGGLAAAFDGVLSQAYTASAVGGHSGGLVGPGTYSFSNYVGKNYSGASDQAIAQATIYPSNDQGLSFGFWILQFNPITVYFSPTITLNLRGKASVPGSASDGTLLGTTTTGSTTSAITILSTDQTTAWKYVWVEMIAVVTLGNGIFGASSYSLTNAIAELVLFNPTGTATSSGIDVEVIGPPLLYTTAIRTWRLGVYSNTTGWPTCGSYHEGRLWLSGVIANRIDACVSNDIKGGRINFAPTDQYGNVLASSAISYVFNAPDTNPIFWMVPDQQGVICGTKAGEWLVQSPTAGGITAFNIAARRVTTIGVANIEPKRTEHTTIFVQKYGRKIMEYFADVFSGKFTAPHITYTGKHLTGGGVLEIAYQQELAPIVWARRADGALIGCTYKRDTLTTSQGPTIAGWHRHELGSDRTVESITVGPSHAGNLDALTIVTNSSDPASTVRHVEVLTDMLDEDSELSEAAYLDNAVTPTSTSTSDVAPAPYGGLTLNGLWHLNGKEVTAWLGGLDCGDYTVADGSITVPYGDGISGGTATGLFTAAFVTSFADGMPMVVGFTYTSQGQLVRPAKGEESGARSGPAVGKKRRSQYVMAHLEGTQGVSFGTDFDNVDAALFRQQNDTPYTVLQQFNGIYREQLTDDYSFDGMLCWQITRPYICNVIAAGTAIHTQDV